MTLEHALLVVDSLAGISAPDGVVEIKRPTPTLTFDLDQIRERLREWEQDFVAGRAEATVRAVRSDWQQFVGWCERNGKRPLPASFEDFHLYMADMVVQGRRKTTLTRYIYTISIIHKAAKVPDPTADERWANKWKALGAKLVKAKRAAPRQAQPLKTDALTLILGSLSDSPRDLRDAAMLCLAADTLCRESELAQVELEHLRQADGDDWTLYLGHTKTDQEGVGAFRFVSAETKARIDHWCSTAAITEGPLFLPLGGRPKSPPEEGVEPRAHLNPKEVARIFRQRAAAAGVAHAGRISGHSTRVGAAIDLIEGGATVSETAAAGGWGSERQVLQYVKQAKAGRNAMSKLRARQRGSH